MSRHVQLRPDPLLFRRHAGQVFDIGVDILLHLQDAFGKHLDLVSRMDPLQRVRDHVVVPYEHARRLRHLLHRVDQGAHQKPGGRRKEQQGGRASHKDDADQIALHILLQGGHGDLNADEGHGPSVLHHRVHGGGVVAEFPL